MELPKKILIGYDVLFEIVDFINSLISCKSLIVVSGENIKKVLGDLMSDALKGLNFEWHIVKEANLDQVQEVVKKVLSKRFELVIGLGGGRSVDVAKLSAFKGNLPFLSVPTSASHDGISSPFASIKGTDKPYSIMAKPPIGIFVDVKIISNAPRRLLLSGCGDLIAKLTAVKDWELARDEKGEYFGRYSAELAKLSANIIMEEAERIANGDEEGVRVVTEALISAGVAAGIAGSSRPCSGSEHLFSHALDLIAPNIGLHGEKCAMGTIMMAKLHGLDWEKIKETLEKLRIPTKAEHIGLSEDLVIKALLLAEKIRPERYTILNKVKLNYDEALKLVKDTGII